MPTTAVIEGIQTEARCAECTWTGDGSSYFHEHPINMGGNMVRMRHKHGPEDVELESEHHEGAEGASAEKHHTASGHETWERTVTHRVYGMHPNGEPAADD